MVFLLIAVPNSKNWNRVRHVFSFSLRRKTSSPSSPQAVHTDRTIPSISISNENDDDNLSNSKDQTKRRINSLKNDNRQGSIGGEDTDQDDEYTENNRIDKKREFYRTDRTDSSSYERPESSASNLFTGTSTGEDENALRRKSSKIGIITFSSTLKRILRKYHRSSVSFCLKNDIFLILTS